MKQFIKFTLASMTGFLLALLLMIFFFAFIIGSAISSFSDDSSVEVKNGSVLEMKLREEIKERSGNNPFENLDLNGFDSQKSAGLNDILKSIKKAAVDERINGIFLNLSTVNSGIASLKEIRNALVQFKSSGKFIYAYGETFSQGAYYLASAADSIFIHPEGDISLQGIGASLMFFKGTLEKLEVEPQIIRHGKFKSAVEPFILDKMSKENREQTTMFISSIWKDMLKDISTARKIPTAELQKIADQLKGRNAALALENKLVDRIAFYDEVADMIRKKNGQKEKEKPRFVELSKYNKAYVRLSSATAPKVAIIYAYGDIVSGKGSEDEIGSDRISEAIRKARTDSSIKAIVFRVNSPGGSALASDVILREAKLAKKVKPFVVSMGDYAASGGYYIACAADTIVAEPTTITGSIGVFGLMYNAQKMLNNKLGITIDTIKTARLSDIGTPYRKMTDEERNIMQEEVERVYDRFISHVSEGRDISKEMVDSIGQGRVWSGADAKNIGLVDVIGGINDAVNIASRMAKLKEFRTVELPEQKEFFEKLMEDLNTEAGVKLAKAEFGEFYETYSYFSSMLRQKGVMAKIPFRIELR